MHNWEQDTLKLHVFAYIVVILSWLIAGALDLVGPYLHNLCFSGKFSRTPS